MSRQQISKRTEEFLLAFINTYLVDAGIACNTATGGLGDEIKPPRVIVDCDKIKEYVVRSGIYDCMVTIIVETSTAKDADRAIIDAISEQILRVLNDLNKEETITSDNADCTIHDIQLTDSDISVDNKKHRMRDEFECSIVWTPLDG